MVFERKPARFTSNTGAHRAAAAVTLISGVFTLIICVLLIANYVQITARDPLNNPDLLQLRKQLAAAPSADPALVEQIRALDLLSRKAFFTSQAHLRMGGYLLLGAVAVFLMALRLSARWASTPPMPLPPTVPESFWSSLFRAKDYVGFVAIALAASALLAGYLSQYEIPYVESDPLAAAGGAGFPTRHVAEEQVGKPAPPVAETAYPDWSEIDLQWPSFRGPGGLGVAHFETAPQRWDVATGENIRWKAQVPLPGFSSPVVWGGRVFLTGATADSREVYCFQADTGELAWKKTLAPFPGTPAKPPNVGEETGFAASTPVAHGDRVCAIFANGDVACLDFEGRELWGRNLGAPENHYGHSSSLAALDHLLFVQLDDSANPRLLALDLATGQEVWSAKRKYISWSSPALIRTGSSTLLLLNSEKDVDAYDPRTGAPAWSVECLDGEVAPSPAFAKGTIFVANEYAKATALRLDPSGNAPPEAVWEWSDSLPEVASPVGSDQYFYIATSMGDVVCLDIETGQKVWSESFDEGFYSSPVRVGDRIYLLDREGTMRIFKTGAVYEELAAIPFGAPTVATPAYLDGRIYVRTMEHLYGIASDGNP